MTSPYAVVERPDEDCAHELDARDPLAAYRERFVFPRDGRGDPVVYLAGNSLGLMPRSARAIVRATERVSPSVVSVVSFRRASNLFSGNMLRDLLASLGQGLPGPALRDQMQAFNFGSGFIIDPSGFVLTNQHVVDGADRIVVTLSTGENLLASVVGSSFDHDLTVLKIAGDMMIAQKLAPLLKG